MKWNILNKRKTTINAEKKTRKEQCALKSAKINMHL